eukprot:2842564-Prymnesium_polylepis.1
MPLSSAHRAPKKRSCQHDLDVDHVNMIVCGYGFTALDTSLPGSNYHLYLPRAARARAHDSPQA